MATLEMPVRSDLAAYDFTIDLEERIYTITMRFNERKGRWVMDIADAGGVALLTGVIILVDINITDQYVNDDLPPGRFFAVDITGERKNPGENDLGNDVKLFYLESEDAA